MGVPIFSISTKPHFIRRISYFPDGIQKLSAESPFLYYICRVCSKRLLCHLPHTADIVFHLQ